MTATTGELRVPGVVLAGGKAKPDLVALTGQTVRALATVNGKTLLRHVVDAMRAAENCGPITVVGNVPPSDDYACLPDGGGFVENIFAGLNAYVDAPFVLISTSDLPFLTGESVADFIRGAAELANTSGAGMIYSIVSVARCYERFPGIKRTARKLREGEFTGGNLVLARPQFMLEQRPHLAAAYAARKSPLRLAGIMGWDTIGRLLVSQLIAPGLLTLPYLEGRASRVLGGPVRAFLSDYPEVATDLDRPSDFAAIAPKEPAR